MTVSLSTNLRSGRAREPVVGRGRRHGLCALLLLIVSIAPASDPPRSALAVLESYQELSQEVERLSDDITAMHEAYERDLGRLITASRRLLALEQRRENLAEELERAQAVADAVAARTIPGFSVTLQAVDEVAAKALTPGARMGALVMIDVPPESPPPAAHVRWEVVDGDGRVVAGTEPEDVAVSGMRWRRSWLWSVADDILPGDYRIRFRYRRVDDGAPEAVGLSPVVRVVAPLDLTRAVFIPDPTGGAPHLGIGGQSAPAQVVGVQAAISNASGDRLKDLPAQQVVATAEGRFAASLFLADQGLPYDQALEAVITVSAGDYQRDARVSFTLAVPGPRLIAPSRVGFDEPSPWHIELPPDFSETVRLEMPSLAGVLIAHDGLRGTLQALPHDGPYNTRLRILVIAEPSGRRWSLTQDFALDMPSPDDGDDEADDAALAALLAVADEPESDVDAVAVEEQGVEEVPHGHDSDEDPWAHLIMAVQAADAQAERIRELSVAQAQREASVREAHIERLAAEEARAHRQTQHRAHERDAQRPSPVAAGAGYEEELAAWKRQQEVRQRQQQHQDRQQAQPEAGGPAPRQPIEGRPWDDADHDDLAGRSSSGVAPAAPRTPAQRPAPPQPPALPPTVYWIWRQVDISDPGDPGKPAIFNYQARLYTGLQPPVHTTGFFHPSTEPDRHGNRAYRRMVSLYGTVDEEEARTLVVRAREGRTGARFGAARYNKNGYIRLGRAVPALAEVQSGYIRDPHHGRLVFVSEELKKLFTRQQGSAASGGGP